MSKSTPGPWHRHGLHIHAQYSSDTGVRHYAVADALEHGGLAAGEAEANARLITAAPRMHWYLRWRSEQGDPEASAILAEMETADV